MVVKKRKVPFRILSQEALIRRLPKSHKKSFEISTNLKKEWAGHRGELNLDYYLSFLPADDYDLFYDLRLEVNGKAFQIDTLLISPYFILIIESKNIYGTLFFDQRSRQLIRTFDNKEEGFPDPVQQAKRQASLLQEWMNMHKIKSCPIDYLVAIGKPEKILKTNPGMEQIFQKILHAEHIPDKIKEMEKAYTEKKITPYLSRKLSTILLYNHQPYLLDVLNYHGIPTAQLLKGVHCPRCNEMKMAREYSTWHCESCHFEDKEAHHASILDYLLISSTHSITNQQCREWLQIGSSELARRLLLTMDLPVTGGAPKLRTYHLQEDYY